MPSCIQTCLIRDDVVTILSQSQPEIVLFFLLINRGQSEWTPNGKLTFKLPVEIQLKASNIGTCQTWFIFYTFISRIHFTFFCWHIKTAFFLFNNNKKQCVQFGSVSPRHLKQQFKNNITMQYFQLCNKKLHIPSHVFFEGKPYFFLLILQRISQLQ